MSKFAAQLSSKLSRHDIRKRPICQSRWASLYLVPAQLLLSCAANSWARLHGTSSDLMKSTVLFFMEILPTA